MNIFPCISYTIMECFFEKSEILFLSFSIVRFVSSICLCSAYSFGIIESDIVRRIIIEHGNVRIRNYILDELSYVFFFCGVATHKTMFPERIYISWFCFGSFHGFELLLDIKSIFLYLQHIIPYG